MLNEPKTMLEKLVKQIDDSDMLWKLGCIFSPKAFILTVEDAPEVKELREFYINHNCDYELEHLLNTIALDDYEEGYASPHDYLIATILVAVRFAKTSFALEFKHVARELNNSFFWTRVVADCIHRMENENG